VILVESSLFSAISTSEVQFFFTNLVTILANCTSAVAIPVTRKQSRSIEARGASHWEIFGWKAMKPATGTEMDFLNVGLHS
jgi:hypothetical protein